MGYGIYPHTSVSHIPFIFAMCDMRCGILFHIPPLVVDKLYYYMIQPKMKVLRSLTNSSYLVAGGFWSPHVISAELFDQLISFVFADTAFVFTADVYLIHRLHFIIWLRSQRSLEWAKKVLSLVESYNKANIFLGLIEHELNSPLGASHLVDYISVHIRFDLERYLLNISPLPGRHLRHHFLNWV